MGVFDKKSWFSVCTEKFRLFSVNSIRYGMKIAENSEIIVSFKSLVCYYSNIYDTVKIDYISSKRND